MLSVGQQSPVLESVGNRDVGLDMGDLSICQRMSCRLGEYMGSIYRRLLLST